MRIHPTFLTPKAKWQFPAAFALLLFLLIMNIARGPRQTVVAAVAPQEKTLEVVVASRLIEAGSPLDNTHTILARRPINTLPADYVVSFDRLEKKVAAGPIPAGAVIASAMLADPVALMKPSEAQAKVQDVRLDPLETLLEEIKKDTVAVPLEFQQGAPTRGARVALAISSALGETVLILDEAWVSEVSGYRATLRVDPGKALFVRSAQRLGTPFFIEIPTEGASPYVGRTVDDIPTLEQALGLKGPKPKSSAAASGAPRRFRSYAWVSGAGVRYGIDEDGAMYMVDGSGREILAPMPESFGKDH